MNIQQEAAEVLAVLQRAESLFPPASTPAHQLRAAVVRIRVIAQTIAGAAAPFAERAILQELQFEIRRANALVTALS